MYKLKSLGLSPISISLLVLVNIPKNFETHFDMSIVGGQSINFNFSSNDMETKEGWSTFNLAIKHCRLILKVSQIRIESLSSSTESLLQYLHFLSNMGVTGRVYRPSSICKLCAEVRYLLNHCLWFLFNICKIYGSRSLKLFIKPHFVMILSRIKQGFNFLDLWQPTINMRVILHILPHRRSLKNWPK